MESPVFRLEGIVKSKDETSDFEGPLVLILQLLSKNKVEIRDISISRILEQYLEYLDAMAELDLDIASEFVAMASHLAYIKTKMLLSGGEEVSELEQLILSLEELQRSDVYMQIKAIAKTFSEMYESEGVMLPGPPEYLPPDKDYVYDHKAVDLLDAVLRVVGRENAMLDSINPRETVYPRRIVFSIPDKISEVLERLKGEGNISLAELFYGNAGRSEMIATFIAVLELCRIGNVLLTGDDDNMMLIYAGTGREESAAEAAMANYE